MKTWTEIRAILSQVPADWSPYADAFEESGCPSSSQSDDPPTILGYLENTTSTQTQVDALSERLTELGASRIEIGVVEDADWSELWKIHFKSTLVGNRFLIRPTWEPPSTTADRIEIVLDPGQAFGTGDHPTTRLCLVHLEDAIDRGHLSASSQVLDLGCGSGILAIGAQKLGVQNVLATDIDPIAVEVTRENFILNSVTATASCVKGFDDPRLDGPFDVIVSNIISATLIRIAADAYVRVKPGGIWIVSGIIAQNWPDVRSAAESCGFQIDSESQEMDWVAATFIRS